MIVVGAAAFLASEPSAAPFADYIRFRQPDGVELTLWGEGDEFRAVFETTHGFTVLYDDIRKAYCYAQLGADMRALHSSGIFAHLPPPATLNRHLRADRGSERAGARARQREWNNLMQQSQRWAQLKAATLQTSIDPAVTAGLPAPPEDPTTGSKVGLTLLIDFSDEPATITREQIDAFCNGDSYTGFGNNGSVKQYFLDVSAGRLTYTNVVTAYVRMEQPKSYYNNTSIDCGQQGRLLINDALAILKARSDYSSTVLPTFAGLTTDGASQVTALNIFYAGGNGGVWDRGLWPNSWALSIPVELGNGMSVYRYQITDIGSAPAIGTFCHENGHLLCGFPDIYDYEYDSQGGAGDFCLMNSGGYGTNPHQVCAYLRTAANWTTVFDFLGMPTQSRTLFAAPSAGFEQVLRFRNPTVPTEYFLLENRQQTGRDSGLPCAGIAVWHIDELGDRDDQRMTPNSQHHNYEVTLVQADGRWDFQNNTNSGDSTDLFFAGNSATGYANRLTDSTTPNAHWWNGTNSQLHVSDFSAPATAMSFTTTGTPPIIEQPLAATVAPGGTAIFTVSTSAPPPLAYSWQKNGSALTDGGSISGSATSTLTISNVQSEDAGSFSVLVSNAYGSSSSQSAPLTLRGQGSVGRQFAVVGASGTILTSADGLAWASRTSGTALRLRGVAASGNLLVAVGEAGTVLTSPDGLSWTLQWTGSTETLRGVAFSTNRWVAVGGASAALVLTSTDGVTWTPASSPSGGKLRSVAYGGGQFVAAGAGGTVLTSPDGRIWTARSIGTTSRLEGVVWTGGSFQLVNEWGTIYQSADGVSWRSQSGFPLMWLEGLAWSGIRGVAIGSQGAITTSTDGSTWNATASGTAATLHGITWSGVPAQAAAVSPAALLGSLALRILTGPDSQVAETGGSATFAVTTTTALPVFYQWSFQGQSIGGATNAALTLNNVQVSNTGPYIIAVTNAAGSATSAAAMLRLAQAITFTGPVNQPFTTAPIALNASATSNLAVTLGVKSGPAIIDGTNLILTGAGTVTIRATQSGSDVYAPAQDVERTFIATPNFASWQYSKFTASELANVNVSGPDVVFGIDGLTNLLKYALGLEPKQNHARQIGELASNGSEWVFTYTRPSSVTDLSYAVEVSTNLVDWTSASVAHEFVSSTAGVDTWRGRYTSSAPTVFFRLKVTPP